MTAGPSDTVATLSSRYGVPPQALLAANGLSSSASVRPGTRLTIPVYAPGSRSTQVAAGPPASTEGRVVTRSKLAESRRPAEPATRPQHVAKIDETRTAETRTAETRTAETRTADTRTAHPRPGRAVASAPSERPVPKLAVAAPKADAAPAKQIADARKPADARKGADQKVASLAPSKSDAPKGREVDSTASLPTNVTAAAAPAPVAPAASAAQTADFRWPAHGRVINGFGGSGANEGINIAVPDGTPVKAAEGGTVAYAGNEVKGYGNLVLIRHENGYVSAYAHNGEIDVKRGQKVSRGQIIAKSGQSGNVTSPQLHFELRKGATPVDPMPHLASN